MTTTPGHVGTGIEPVADTRLHRTLWSLAVGLAVAICTLIYVYMVTYDHSPATFMALAPFIFVVSMVGVGLPAYLAVDMLHRQSWLTAVWASCLALLMSFTIFWTAAVVATYGSAGVHVGSTPVAAVEFDPDTWRSDTSARLAMAKDLCSSGRLRGLTAAEVRVQLGEPMTIVGPGVREMCYSLTAGEGQEATPTPALLDVVFSSEGRVASTALVGAQASR